MHWGYELANVAVIIATLPSIDRALTLFLVLAISIDPYRSIFTRAPTCLSFHLTLVCFILFHRSSSFINLHDVVAKSIP